MNVNRGGCTVLGVVLIVVGAFVTAIAGGWWTALGLPVCSAGSLLIVTQVTNHLSRR